MNNAMDEQKLCALVKSFSCIYDRGSAYNKKREHRTKAWKEIAAELRKTETECQKYWTKIRRGFIHYLKRRRANPNITPYRLAQHLTFLKPFVDAKVLPKRKHPATNDNINKNSKTTPSIKNWSNVLPKRKRPTNIENINKIAPLNKLPSTSAAAVSAPVSATTPTPTATAITSTPNTSITNNNQCADQQFLKDVLCTMKKMNERQKTEFKYEVYKNLDKYNNNQ